MGNYSDIKDKWGVLPIYVGQQDARTGHGTYVPSSILTEQQGATDGADACNLVADENFPRGTVVYLDWEYGGLDGDGSDDYIKAWISAVVADGRARPGIYCSHVAAQAVVDVIDTINPTPNVRFFCWKVTNANRHDFTGDITSLPELDPKGCGYAGALVWQREQRADVTFPDGAPLGTLEMDFSTSSLTDPGAPDTAVVDLRFDALDAATVKAKRRPKTIVVSNAAKKGAKKKAAKKKKVAKKRKTTSKPAARKRSAKKPSARKRAVKRLAVKKRTIKKKGKSKSSGRTAAKSSAKGSKKNASRRAHRQ